MQQNLTNFVVYPWHQYLFAQVFSQSLQVVDRKLVLGRGEIWRDSKSKKIRRHDQCGQKCQGNNSVTKGKAVMFRKVKGIDNGEEDQEDWKQCHIVEIVTMGKQERSWTKGRWLNNLCERLYKQFTCVSKCTVSREEAAAHKNIYFELCMWWLNGGRRNKERSCNTNECKIPISFSIAECTNKKQYFV